MTLYVPWASEHSVVGSQINRAIFYLNKSTSKRNGTKRNPKPKPIDKSSKNYITVFLLPSSINIHNTRTTKIFHSSRSVPDWTSVDKPIALHCTHKQTNHNRNRNYQSLSRDLKRQTSQHISFSPLPRKRETTRKTNQKIKIRHVLQQLVLWSCRRWKRWWR